MENPERRRKLTILALILSNCDRFGGMVVTCTDEGDDNMLLVHEQFGRRPKVPHIDIYAEEVVPQQTCDDFKSHFRLSRSTFEMLVCELSTCPKDTRQHW